MENKKEQLQKELDKIKAAEWKELVEKHYPEFKQLEGKCFKSRSRYSGNSKGWWHYTKVVKIEKKDLYMGANQVLSHFKGWSFQLCEDGKIDVQTEKYNYCHSLEKEITEAEFNEAYNKMIDALNAIAV